MKHLIKNIAVLWISTLFIFLSIESSYAGDTNTLKSITATSTKTVELKLDKKVNKIFTDGDLEIYRFIKNNATIVKWETNKVLLKLTKPLEKNTSYSLISVSSLEWDIIFKTGDELTLKEIENTELEPNKQGIKNVLIKDSSNLVLTFSQDIDSKDLEFQLLKTFEVDKIKNLIDTDKIEASLKKEMLNNQDYLWTITFLENSKSEKLEILKWINYFKTGELPKYKAPFSEELDKQKDSNADISLEEELKNALAKSTGSVSKENKDLLNELNSASDKPINNKKTQLEKLALSQKEIPETGAETWILLLATFIINTFYFISRKKKRNIA